MAKEKNDGTVVIHKSTAVLKVVSRFEDIHVVKAKLKPNYTLDCAYVDQHKDRKNEVAQSSDALTHEDLRVAFKALRIHLALMCDLKESSHIKFEDYEEIQMRLEKPANYIDELEKIHVTGFTISSGQDGEGVTLTGTKQIGSKVLNLNSPFTKFDDPDYAYCSELQIYVLNAAEEVKEYLNGKAAMKQLEMFEEDTAQAEKAAGF